MNKREDFRQRIETSLSRVLEEKDRLPGLYEPVSHMLTGGGKRFRPLLVMLGCDLFGENVDKSLPAALGIELFHTFTLMHDDIMDEALVRRGQRSVYGQWGRDRAILSGDATLVKAYQQLEELPRAILPSVFRKFNGTALEVCEGQQMDMDFEDREEVPLEQYLAMIRKKTAALIAGSLDIGGLIAGAEEVEQERLRGFGYSIGVAFQILDDLLDLYSENEAFGKEIGGDIKAHKKTFLLISAQEKADEEQQKRLGEAMRVESPEEKVERVREVFETLGVREEAVSTIRSYHQEAMDHLERIEVPSEKKEMLRELGASLVERTH